MVEEITHETKFGVLFKTTYNYYLLDFIYMKTYISLIVC